MTVFLRHSVFVPIESLFEENELTEEMTSELNMLQSRNQNMIRFDQFIPIQFCPEINEEVDEYKTFKKMNMLFNLFSLFNSSNHI